MNAGFTEGCEGYYQDFALYETLIGVINRV
jgi:hypothetical protein